MLGPGSVLGHLHRHLVPGVLGIAAAACQLHGFLQAGVIDARGRCFGDGGDGSAGQLEAEVVGDVAVGVVVGDEVESGELGVERRTFSQVDCRFLPALDALCCHDQRPLHQRAAPGGFEAGAGFVLACGSHFHLVGTEVDVAGEWHDDFHLVVLRPAPQRQCHVAAWLVALTDALAIDLDVEAFGGPVGHAQLQHEGLLRFGEGEGRVLGGPLAVLLDGCLLGIPAGGRRQVESHPQRVLAHEVGCLLVLHVVLHSRAAAAGGLRRLVAPGLGGVQTHGVLVEHGIVTRIQRADELVVEHTLVVVHIAGVVRTEAVEVLGQFRQVVGTAGLVQGGLGVGRAVAPVGTDVRTHREHLRVGLTEHLAVAHTAHGIAVATLDHRPEVLGEVVVVGVGVAAEGAQGTRHHRDVLVGMAGADGIYVLRQWREEGGAVEVCAGL